MNRSISNFPYALMGMLGLLTMILPAGDAMAAYYHPWVTKSHVTSNVSETADTWNYTYTLFNDSYEGIGPSAPMPIIVDWELPWFDDANITNIISPVGWTYSIEKIGIEDIATGWNGKADWQDPSDPLYQGKTSPFTTVTQVLHWYCDPQDYAIYPNGYPTGTYIGSLAVFGFTSSYSNSGAPYQSSWVGLWHWTGDPNTPLTGVPGSPDTLGSTPVPEPATMLLLGSGLVGLAGFRKKFFKK